MGFCFGLYIEIQTGVCFLFCSPCDMLLTARKIRNNKPQITHLQGVFFYLQEVSLWLLLYSRDVQLSPVFMF
jgi:hypothetical protein